MRWRVGLLLARLVSTVVLVALAALAALAWAGSIGLIAPLDLLGRQRFFTSMGSLLTSRPVASEVGERRQECICTICAGMLQASSSSMGL